jgi:hypothetical protein
MKRLKTAEIPEKQSKLGDSKRRDASALWLLIPAKSRPEKP